MIKIEVEISQKTFNVLSKQSQFLGNTVPEQAAAFLENGIEKWYNNLDEKQKEFFDSFNGRKKESE